MQRSCRAGNKKGMDRKQLLALGIVLIFLITPIVVLRATNNLAPNHPQRTTPIRIACVGDSITQITKYTADLQAMLGSNYTVGNFGVSGSTVSLSTYKPYMNQPEFQDAENFQPDVVVIMLGTNDAHDDLQQYIGTFDDDYYSLIDSFQNLTNNPQVWIVESPPVYSNTMGISPNFFSDKVIPHIQNVANQEDVPIIDVYDAFGNHSDYTGDGIHPNDDGAALIAFQVYDALTPWEDTYSSSS
jgi:acyl-CoA thioesterase I